MTITTALEARLERRRDAWQRWEASLARGLFDELTTRRNRPFTPDERGRQEDLVGQLSQLDNQIGAFAGTPVLANDRRKQVDDLKARRLELQGRLSELEATLVGKYGVAAGVVYNLDQIQARLPAEAALVGWVDVRTPPNAADPRGDHWACVVRRTRSPLWVRIKGTGPDGAWTAADESRPGQVGQLLSDARSSAWQAPLAELANQRLAPLDAALRATADLPAIRHLIVLPSPAFAGIPIEALVETRPAGAARYLVSYAPSGTMFAWIQERRFENPKGQTQSASLLALGDPEPPPSEQPGPLASMPPDHGLLVRMVQPASNAASAGIKPGDVLLSYAGAKVTAPEGLQKLVQSAAPKATAVVAAVWRDGKTIDLQLKPGSFEIEVEPRPAAAAILAQRENDALLRRTRGISFTRLPGSRREVQAIASLFERKDVFLGSDASEQLLDGLRRDHKLEQFSVIHLATHGKMDDLVPMNSRLMLSQDHLIDPTAASSLDTPYHDGTITAGEVMSTWKLNADLVTSGAACQTGLGRSGGGEGIHRIRTSIIPGRRPQPAHQPLGGRRPRDFALDDPVLPGLAGESRKD